MISFDTKRFGRLEVAEDRIISFPNGMIGFPDVKKFVLMDYKDTLLKWLQSVDVPEVAFIVIQPFEFFSDYTLKIDRSTREFLGINSEEEVSVLTILRVDDKSNVTVNLQGPLVINSTNRKGMQVVNEDPRFSCRTPLKAVGGQASEQSAGS